MANGPPAQQLSARAPAVPRGLPARLIRTWRKKRSEIPGRQFVGRHMGRSITYRVRTVQLIGGGHARGGRGRLT